MNNDYTTKDSLEYNASNIHILNKVCMPLTRLGFDTFFYNRIYLNTSRVFSLCTNLPWAKYFIDHNILTSSKFLNAINSSIKNKSHTLIMPKIDVAETLGVFNMIANFDCVQNQYIENWGVASSSANLDTVETYINNEPTFRKFLAYFKERTFTILMDAERNNALYRVDGVLANNAPCENELNLGNIAPKKWHIRVNDADVFLSEQQMKCFYHIISGSSTKWTSRALGISPKTVEFHLVQLKLKLHCSYKSELAKIAERNFINKFAF